MNDRLPASPDLVRTPVSNEAAPEQLSRLWRQGQRPDVDAFLARAGRLSPAQVTAVLRVDQGERWQVGLRVKAERYLHRYPDVRTHSDCALDLLFNELLARERLGERPSLEEYARRFPQHADRLKAQWELHRQRAEQSIHPTVDPQASTVATTVEANLDTPVRVSRGSPILPEQFGRYRIIKELGRGGMGTVYLAHDTQLDRRVALKVPHFAEAGEFGQPARFYREARLAATFVHPNLCPIHDVGQIGGIHYLSMPYLQGELLAAWLRREGRLPPRTAARLIYLIARAMQVAHRAGVIHRDLKPSNVMLTEHRAPVVMDFGLARRDLLGDLRMTPLGTMLGTAAYAAPEQVEPSSEKVGPATDIYSLGVMLYELLTGQLPFRGSLYEVMKQARTSEPPPPSQFLPDLNPGLELVCLKAMAKDPNERFASMDEFAGALIEYFRNSWPVIDVTASEDTSTLDFPVGGAFQPARVKSRAAPAPSAPPWQRPQLVGFALGALAVLALVVVAWILLGGGAAP
jgi:hypothetical protein